MVIKHIEHCHKCGRDARVVDEREADWSTYLTLRCFCATNTIVDARTYDGCIDKWNELQHRYDIFMKTVKTMGKCATCGTLPYRLDFECDNIYAYCKCGFVRLAGEVHGDEYIRDWQDIQMKKVKGKKVKGVSAEYTCEKVEIRKTPKYDNLEFAEKMAKKFGVEHQDEKLKEELGELLEILTIRSGVSDELAELAMEKVVDEIADVLLTLDQFMINHDIVNKVIVKKRYKQIRTEGRYEI